MFSFLYESTNINWEQYFFNHVHPGTDEFRNQEGKFSRLHLQLAILKTGMQGWKILSTALF